MTPIASSHRRASGYQPERQVLARGRAGRWEGDTLVVEVTGLNGKGWFDSTGQFYSENTRMVERWTLVDANTIDYEVTVEDPTIYTRPWKMTFPKRRAGTGPAVLEA